VFREFKNITLVIAGGGDYEPTLQAIAAGASNIHFVGRLLPAQLQSLYKAAIATVVPSLCYETFGLIVAESFSTSTPVLVYAQSSLQEIVQTYGGGLLYHNEAELRSAIARLHSDTDLREQLGRQGRAAYDAEFAEAAFLHHYLAVVQALLARKQAGRPLNVPDDPTTTPLLAGRPVFFAQGAVGASV
jgi:glycosyltransferase involved in cell wall biosynthesis